ncbi:MAG: DUF192 domain-containing protein [Robiginitomaculum sp.]|nr:DUF192 domain-containing protein [Robiginitomaculum sp.]MDQ7076364.1 DUF192 domain-containing protein [Robiginitomaculum sp.]
MKTLIIALLALFTVPLVAFADEAEPKRVEFGPSEPLMVETQNGPVSFLVEFANTDEERAQGLMFRTELADNAGMLFDFDGPRQVNMWMKNTLIPLDMIFIGADGHIISIARNARPKSLRTIPSGGMAAAVLEISGGGARKHGIARGDLVRHAMFGNAPDAVEDAEKDLPDEAKAPKRTPD